jgi:hypothetical protein
MLFPSYPDLNVDVDSSVGSDSLWVGRSGDRIPMRARFSVPIQTDPGAHSASCTKGYRVSFLCVKRPGCYLDHQTPFSAEFKEKIDLYLYSLCGPSWSVLRWTCTLVRISFISPLPQTDEFFIHINKSRNKVRNIAIAIPRKKRKNIFKPKAAEWKSMSLG